MCESASLDYDENLLKGKVKQNVENVKTICMKCNVPDISVVNHQGAFCNDCFQVFVIHKFRAAIGRTKLIKNGENILIAFSGGANSAALLHLVEHGKSDRAHRKLRFVPSVLYVDESGIIESTNSERLSKISDVINLLIPTGFPVYMAHLEQAIDLKRQEDGYESLYTEVKSCDVQLPSKDQTDKLKNAITNLSSVSSAEDFYKHLRSQLIVSVAKQLAISKVLTAENCTKLAVLALSSVSQGRGSQISISTSFSDSRYNDVMIIRPMRDLSSPDVISYNKICGVKSICNSDETKVVSENSIESLTEAFILNLQKDFPSTVSNIKRTSEKLDLLDLQLPKCSFCQSPLDSLTETSSALAALRFSQNLSHSDNNHDIFQAASSQAFCYGCCLTLKNYKGDVSKMPEIIRESLPSEFQ